MIRIPVAMATDNNYVPLVVAVTSLVKNSAEDTFYDIYILIDDTFCGENQEIIEKYFITFRGQCSIIYKNVGHSFDNVSSTIAHITQPTFYRLLLPGILNEDKCIYLDTDTIIMSDLKELYNAPLDGCYVAGVKHPGYILFETDGQYCKKIGIPSVEQYINAGVLVLNLKEMRKDGVMKRFLDLLPEKFPAQDQDIINSVCYGKTAFISFKYNVMTQCNDLCIKDYQGIYPEAEVAEAWNKPCIIHYASPLKPWNSSESVFTDYWWETCRVSRMLEDLISDFFSEFVFNIIYHFPGSMFAKNMPLNFDLAFNRNYAIYGAGKRAREFISFMKSLGIIPKFIIVSNIEKNPSEVEGIVVKNIKDQADLLHDKTIIIATRQILHKEIVKCLQQYEYQELLPLSDNWKK